MNAKRYMYVERVITVLIFIVSPFLSFPLIVRSLFERQKFGVFMFALFMGLIGLVYTPSGDLYRYHLMFHLYAHSSWKMLFVGEQNLDFLLNILSYFFGHLGFHSDIIRFIYNFLGFYLLGDLSLKLYRNNIEYFSNNKMFGVLLLLILLLPAYSFEAYLTRFRLSAVFFVYGVYFIIILQRKVGYFWLFLAGINHWSFVFFILALILVRCGFLNVSRTKFLLIVLTFIFIGLSFTTVLSNFSFFSGLMNRINSYDTSNYMNAVRDGDASVKFMYLIMLQTFLPLFFVIFYCFYYNKFSPYNSLINVFILLALLNPWFSTVQIRYMSVVVFFIKIVTISTFKGDKDVLKKMIWLVRISFLLFLISIYSSRTSLKVGYVSKICTSSFIELVQFHYTDEWINSNINARGDLKKSMK